MCSRLLDIRFQKWKLALQGSRGDHGNMEPLDNRTCPHMWLGCCGILWKWKCSLLGCVWLFCNPMDCSLPGSSVHGILQAGILEWVAFPFSRGSSWPRDQTWISYISGRFFKVWATWEAHSSPLALQANCSFGPSFVLSLILELHELCYCIEESALLLIPGCTSWLPNILPTWPEASDLASLNLSFFVRNSFGEY